MITTFCMWLVSWRRIAQSFRLWLLLTIFNKSKWASLFLFFVCTRIFYTFSLCCLCFATTKRTENIFFSGFRHNRTCTCTKVLRDRIQWPNGSSQTICNNFLCSAIWNNACWPHLDKLIGQERKDNQMFVMAIATNQNAFFIIRCCECLILLFATYEG